MWQSQEKKKKKQNMFLQVDSDGHNRIHWLPFAGETELVTKTADRTAD